MLAERPGPLGPLAARDQGSSASRSLGTWPTLANRHIRSLGSLRTWHSRNQGTIVPQGPRNQGDCCFWATWVAWSWRSQGPRGTKRPDQHGPRGPGGARVHEGPSDLINQATMMTSQAIDQAGCLTKGPGNIGPLALNGHEGPRDQWDQGPGGGSGAWSLVDWGPRSSWGPGYDGVETPRDHGPLGNDGSRRIGIEGPRDQSRPGTEGPKGPTGAAWRVAGFGNPGPSGIPHSASRIPQS